MQQLTNMKEKAHHPTSYPTRSLREYLAYQSVDEAEGQEGMGAVQDRVEVEVEVGNGRSEIIIVDAQTDIKREADNFCRRHHLEGYVSDLLANTLRERFQNEMEEAQHQSGQIYREKLAEVYSNPHARPVLIPTHEPNSESNRKSSAVDRSSAEKGAGKLLRGYHSKAKKYSLGENYLIENKENQPELNKVSLEICSKLGKENILQQRSQRSQEKRKALLRELQAKEEEMMRQCPFKPKINAISKQVDREIASSSLQQQRTQRFQRLFDDHRQMQQRRQEERQQYLQQLPFRPALNYISRKIVEGKRQANNQSQQRTEKKSSHMICSHATNNSLPHTGRKPINRNIQNLPIGEYLYSQAMKKSKPKQPQQKTEVKALDHSDRMVAALKERRINEVFNELTQPPHEELYCQDLDLVNEAFRFGKYRPFVPIFNEMVEMNISLTRAQFQEACLSLIKTMSPEEKHEVIFSKEKDNTAQLQQSNAFGKSRETTKRSSYAEIDIYNRGVQHRKYVEEKIERRRQDKVRSELRLCTFRPVLN